MILLESLIREDMKRISWQQAQDNKFFGPVYHGTSQENREKIDREGFKVFVGHERSGEISHGYEADDYSGGIPAPIHHLGYGIYFTTSYKNAKQFNFGSGGGLKTYYLDIPNMETINFGSPNTMMKWWLAKGYDYNKNLIIFDKSDTVYGENKHLKIQQERIRATIAMTKYLKWHYDGVWFKGKGIHRLLDGDQVVVFDADNIYQIDKLLIKKGEVGSKVVAKVGIDPYNRGEITIPMGTKGTIVKKEKPNELQKWAEGSNFIYVIHFQKGGTLYNVLDKWIDFL